MVFNFLICPIASFFLDYDNIHIAFKLIFNRDSHRMFIYETGRVLRNVAVPVVDYFNPILLF